MDGVLTIEDLFAGRLFRVPDYQRGYAWETNPHLEDFIDDLEALEPESQHYTGTIVLHDQVQPSVFDKEGNSYRLFDIVDGDTKDVPWVSWETFHVFIFLLHNRKQVHCIYGAGTHTILVVSGYREMAPTR